MAPHPDDFDVIAITLRRFAAVNATLDVAVMTSGASGVDDADAPGLDRRAKAQLRESEQTRSCAYFGLSADRLHFLRLADDAAGHLAENPDNETAIRDCLRRWQPDMVFLPHPNDPNLAHQRTYAMLRRALELENSPAVLFLNRDPKTMAMRYDLFVGFDEAEAQWKRTLLRHHESQQRRNVRTRGKGLDERILELNAALAAASPNSGPYAEAFELRTATSESVAQWPPA